MRAAWRVAAGSLLLASCALPPGPQGGTTRPAAGGAVSAPPLSALRVSDLRGKAWVQRDGRSVALQPGSTVAENQPIQVGTRSSLRLQLGDHAFELAPNARLVVHQLPRRGRGEARETWLRLEQGYLRIQWSGAAMDPPMQISFGIWAARLRPGEYFFDTRGRVAAACAASGSMRLSGVPEWTPQGALQECLKLEANKSPLAIALNDAQWSAVRAQRRLHPTLARAARSQSAAAIARLEREQVRSPGPRPVAPPPPPARAPEPERPAPAVAVAPREVVPREAIPRTPIAVAPGRGAPVAAAPVDDDPTRERTAEELIREAEGVRDTQRAIAPAPVPPAATRSRVVVTPPPSPVEPARPAPPPPPVARHSPPVIVIPAEPRPAPPPPPPPARIEAAPPVIVAEPPRVRHAPPVITIPAEPDPEAVRASPPPGIATAPPPSAAAPTYRPHTPPVITIPAEPDPEPVAPPPTVAMAPPPPPAASPSYAPHTPPVITIPVEPAPSPIAPASPPPPPPAAPPVARAAPPVITIPAEPDPPAVAPPAPASVARAEPPPPAIELAEQSPVVIPPPSQPPPPDSTPRARGPTPPSVPLDVAMYSVAAMPDKIAVAESALIVPPTITHEPARSQWLVNIASYPSMESAQEHARMLVRQKLPAAVREQALPDRMSYLVVIEGFATEETAEAAAIDLEAHFDLDLY